MTETVTRATFESQRQGARRIRRRDMNMLAVISVTLGLAQLALIRWADSTLSRPLELTVAGGVFLAYITLIGALLWRMERRYRAACPRCPACGRTLIGMSDRVAAATGRCDACGGQIIG